MVSVLPVRYFAENKEFQVLSRAMNTTDRKSNIIEAAMDVLYDKGFCALKIRDVALRADVSAGLICHHYDTKHGLLLEVVRHAVTAYSEQSALVAAQDLSPNDKVLALVRMALAPEQSNKRLSRVWLTLYYMAGSDDEFHAELLRYQQINLEMITSAISSLFPSEAVPNKARLIVALIDGVWLQHATQAGTVDLGVAQDLVANLTKHALLGP